MIFGTFWIVSVCVFLSLSLRLHLLMELESQGEWQLSTVCWGELLGAIHWHRATNFCSCPAWLLLIQILRSFLNGCRRTQAGYLHLFETMGRVFTALELSSRPANVSYTTPNQLNSMTKPYSFTPLQVFSWKHVNKPAWNPGLRICFQGNSI